ncbi:unnamed protein product [Cryptosporidium hominis]|uniref:Mannosyltransferase n=1 Tax=Cryptosporidium hominis TaxID=237895 RepID=A0A0S4TD97_CRYHO|nr:hypothetical protein [Cryptosporidium hominis TU502]OLQ16030.1 GPI mannosyltransferase 3 [Cryptosporidium hominis]PPA63292.1 Alg9-like mannosyltransferase family protein [Cryptosporidium hominis]PPS93742.1 GPI mannosyltransferase [Cryptosporidium hominis]CUV05300.1 unnamed protein product [Cryptosporidium hominis]|eukprot:PPS93742.1 GPI mannosyltransferase [Cryptosporidium hominis]
MVYIIIIVFRILNSLFIRTTYNPDEYWQSLEVAHKIVNGFGYLTWEWEPCVSLRSIIHPLIFTICYIIINFFKKIVKFFCKNNYQCLYHTNYYFIIPRLYQSIFAILTDIGTSKVAYSIFHKNYYARMETKIEDSDNKFKNNYLKDSIFLKIPFYQKICNKYELDFVTLFISLFSWYNFYTLCRTYAQTVENCINIWSIYFIIKSEKWMNGSYSDNKSLIIGIFLSSLSVLVRHSSIQFWLILYLILIIFQIKDIINKGSKYSIFTIVKLLKICIVVAFITIPVMLYLDYLFYKKFTIPMINFVKFNFIGDPGQIYGSNSRLYYFTETPIVTLLSYLPFMFLGIIESFNLKNQIFKISQISTLITMILLSTTSHKEHRFIIPYFPILLITTSLGIYKLILEIHKFFKMDNINFTGLLFSSINISQIYLNNKYLLITLLAQIIPAFFFTTIFQRGGESAIRYLSNLNLQKNESIFFVSQCHMYPAYSFLNQDVKFGFFDCSPNINQPIKHKNMNEILWANPNTTQLLEEIFVINPLLNTSYPSPYISSNITKLNTSNSENCLNYRFNRKLSGEFPKFFVINSHFNENLQEWLHKHNYKLIRRVFDSFFLETPIGLLFWSYLYIYEKI